MPFMKTIIFSALSFYLDLKFVFLFIVNFVSAFLLGLHIQYILLA